MGRGVQWEHRDSKQSDTGNRETVGTRNRLHRETVRTLDTVGAENNGQRGHDSLYGRGLVSPLSFL